eukprot:gnl/MRDRNA2_/MRDRNA2_91168_c0_seq1.p1 gnl/MRDRNA2_/MRDRNA2_91168_c0~~gnl/MRDRNA2_/MRDRNA2_91168_c0_seq1.p1  ORF type:complete len:261 (+),score=52.29 gnl/MRDRNA2_/MRDRNA2_91168_c0_seq1:95-877(+)
MGNSSEANGITPTTMDKIRIVVLLSGGGTTMQNIMEKTDQGYLNTEIALVISSKEGVKGLERAKARNIPTKVIESKTFRANKVTDWTAMSKAINEHVLAAKPDLVVLAGFMCLYEVPPQLEGKVMNIHPGLIPAFCGQGMYGEKVHQAVVKKGVKVTGCTVHFVTNEYDAGPIIVQKTCPVHDTDTAEDVQKKVFDTECEAFPEAIRLFGEGRLSIADGIVQVRRVAAPCPSKVPQRGLHQYVPPLLFSALILLPSLMGK